MAFKQAWKQNMGNTKKSSRRFGSFFKKALKNVGRGLMDTAKGYVYDRTGIRLGGDGEYGGGYGGYGGSRRSSYSDYDPYDTY